MIPAASGVRTPTCRPEVLRRTSSGRGVLAMPAAAAPLLAVLPAGIGDDPIRVAELARGLA